MSATVRDSKYRQHRPPNYSSNGSLARDLDWAVRERELRHAGEAPRHRQEEVSRQQSRAHAMPRVRERQQVSVFTVTGVAAVMVMAALVVFSYIQLTTIAIETVELKSELSELESEHAALTAQYEQMFDLATVREAAEAAGMTKPSSSQICYLDISDGDTAVVYQNEEPSALDDALACFKEGLFKVVEYFK